MNFLQALVEPFKRIGGAIRSITKQKIYLGLLAIGIVLFICLPFAVCLSYSLGIEPYFDFNTRLAFFVGGVIWLGYSIWVLGIWGEAC